MQVLVVGAGPVGLSAALALRARGLAVTVLEAEPADRVRPGSRAIFVHRESLRLLDAASPGLGSRIAARGVVWQGKRTLWRGREVYARRYPPPRPGLPPFTSLPQTETEQLMSDAAAGVEIVHDARVADVAVGCDGVRLTAADGRSWTAPYVIGADGARSAVRAAIGATMTGHRSANDFVIVDVAADPADPRPAERVFHYEHPGAGGRHVLFVPFAGGWRVDLQCRANDDPAVFSGVDGVRRWLPSVMSGGYADRISWVSTYRFLQVVADRFTDPAGRVLLVGEAAHLFAPFGARGMNSGIADAVAAAEAIRQALADSRSPAVATFAVERRAAALFNRDAAGQALAVMRGRDPRIRAKRGTAALLAGRAARLPGLATTARRAGAWLDAAPYGPVTPATTKTKY